MARVFVPAYRLTWEAHHPVDRNVLLVQNVLQIALALIKSASIHAQEFVDSTRDAKQSITVRFVVVMKDILVIHSWNASIYLVSFKRKSFIHLHICDWTFNYHYFFADEPPIPSVNRNPCAPSPCGPFSMCQAVGDLPSCTCLQNYIGSPPNCRPECTINSECVSNRACIREKCRDPCPGSCGIGAQCTVINHTPTCTCPEGYTGDPFNNCFPKPPTRKHLLPYTSLLKSRKTFKFIKTKN